MSLAECRLQTTDITTNKGAGGSALSAGVYEVPVTGSRGFPRGSWDLGEHGLSF